VVQAAVGVDIDAAVEEPLQAGGVLEVELVVDEVLMARPVEYVEERGVALLARVVEGVLVALGAAVHEQPGELEVAPLDGVEERRHPPLAAPFHGVAVRVGARVEQQPRARAHVLARGGRAAQEHEQRRQAVDGRGRRGRVRPQQLVQRLGVSAHQRPLDPVLGRRLLWQIGHRRPLLSRASARSSRRRLADCTGAGTPRGPRTGNDGPMETEVVAG